MSNRVTELGKEDKRKMDDFIEGNLTTSSQWRDSYEQTEHNQKIKDKKRIPNENNKLITKINNQTP